jgi:hypothetical protein
MGTRWITLCAVALSSSGCVLEFPAFEADGSAPVLLDPPPMDRPPDAQAAPDAGEGAPDAAGVEDPDAASGEVVLRVEAGEDHQLGSGTHAFDRVDLEGELLIIGAVVLVAPRVALSRVGRIIGAGRGRPGLCDGAPGGSQLGRGSGGGGASSQCLGGLGGGLTDGSEPGRAGTPVQALDRAGCQGGEGGDLQGQGGGGGRGGASLRIVASVCELAGAVDLTGADGRTAGRSDGGGGGGGAGGTLILECDRLEVGPTATFRTNGGAGGQGGEEDGFTGGGGGGGAAGPMRIRVVSADIAGNETPVDTVRARMLDRIQSRGGAGGPPGRGGPQSEAGRPGGDCPISVTAR